MGDESQQAFLLPQAVMQMSTQKFLSTPDSNNKATLSIFYYTQSQKKRNFSSWIFPGAQGQGHVTLDHGYTLFSKRKATFKMSRFFWERV